MINLSCTSRIDKLYSSLIISIFSITSSLRPSNSFSCRIHRTLAVPGDFNCQRLPVSRTYLYRFAVRKPEFAKEPQFNLRNLSIFSPLARDDLAIVEKAG